MPISTDQLLLTTGAITREGLVDDPRGLIATMRALQPRAFEVMVYPPWMPRLTEVAELITATGIRTPVVHADKSLGPGLSSGAADDLRAAVAALDATCRFATDIGAGTVVIHLWGLPDSDRLIEHNLAGLPALLDVAESHGVALAVESLLCAQTSPLPVLQRCLERDSRTQITLDLEFLAFHDELEAALAADWLWPQVRHVHAKDFDGQLNDPVTGRRRYLHPGEGTLDLSGWLNRAVDQRGHRGTITLEIAALTDHLEVDWPRLNQSLAWLDALAKQ